MEGLARALHIAGDYRMAGTLPAPQFFSPENTERIMAQAASAVPA